MPRSRIDLNGLLKKLQTKAERRTVLPEDLLAVAAHDDPSAIAVLEGLRARYLWPDSNFDGPDRVVPLGRWAVVVCRYLREHADGLADLAISPTQPELDRELAVAVLESIPSLDSVRALIRIAAATDPQTDEQRYRASAVVRAFNQILSFDRKQAIQLSEAEVQQVRDYVHGFLDVAVSDAEASSAYCALRGVGNEDSLRRIQARPLLSGPYCGVEESVCKAIRKRMK